MLNLERVLAITLCLALTSCGKSQDGGSASEIKEKNATVNAGVFGYSRKQVDDVSTYYRFPNKFTDSEFLDLAKRYVQAYATIENNDQVAAIMTINGYADTADAFKRQDMISANRSVFDQLYANKDGRIAVTYEQASIEPYDFGKKAFPFHLRANIKDGVVYSLRNYGYGSISVQGVPILGQTSFEKEPWIYRPKSEDEAKQIESQLANNRGSANSAAYVDQVFYGRVVKASMTSSERPNLVIIPDRVDLVINNKVLWSINAKELEEMQSRAEKEDGSYNVADETVEKLLGIKK